MSDNRGLYIEESIKNAVKRLLSGRVNEILGEVETPVPPIEFTPFPGGGGVCPAVEISTCERTEKERIIRLEVYALSVVFTLPEHEDGERLCYAYAAAFGKALGEDTTLEGLADRAEMTGKKYRPPKADYCGEGWGLTLTLRIVVEGINQ